MKISKLRYRPFQILLVTVLVFFGCTEGNSGFLDPDTSDVLDRYKVFTDSVYTYRYQSRLYGHLIPTYFADGGMNGASYLSWSGMTDDCINKNGRTSPGFNMNEIVDASNSNMRNHWQNCYEGISRINILLKNIEISPLTAQTKTTLKAEARLIRAWLYFHLLRLYGGVPLVGDYVFKVSDKVDIPRASFERVVDYITRECDELAQILPEWQGGREYGRLTSGAALAIKSRVLLFAASPLSNGKVPQVSDELKPLLGYETYDVNRWKLAADAAKAVIDLNRYELITDNSKPGLGFYKMQTLRVNKEYIFSVMKAKNRYPEEVLLPDSRGGKTALSPFQNLVDAFLMDNGLAITAPNSGYNPQKPYENREPRFYSTILYQGSLWIPQSNSSTPQAISFLYGKEPDGLGTGGGTLTGYACRKLCDEEVTASQGDSDKILPIIRLGEIYLNYVEALNEDDPTNKAEIEKYLIAIRKRAGIKPGVGGRYGLPVSYTQEQMRELIQQERRIELAFEEGHRFFDLKRWEKLEEVKNNVDFYGIKWTLSESNELRSEPYFVETRKFDTKRQYYYPIPLREISIIGSDILKQNPGW
ncbi:MAG: RagB/SusD family nutrient uptake outer membrane protein [Bacteroides sp.]